MLLRRRRGRRVTVHDGVQNLRHGGAVSSSVDPVPLASSLSLERKALRTTSMHGGCPRRDDDVTFDIDYIEERAAQGTLFEFMGELAAGGDARPESTALRVGLAREALALERRPELTFQQLWNCLVFRPDAWPLLERWRGRAQRPWLERLTPPGGGRPELIFYANLGDLRLQEPVGVRVSADDTALLLQDVQGESLVLALGGSRRPERNLSEAELLGRRLQPGRGFEPPLEPLIEALRRVGAGDESWVSWTVIKRAAQTLGLRQIAACSPSARTIVVRVGDLVEAWSVGDPHAHVAPPSLAVATSADGRWAAFTSLMQLTLRDCRAGGAADRTVHFGQGVSDPTFVDGERLLVRTHEAMGGWTLLKTSTGQRTDVHVPFDLTAGERPRPFTPDPRARPRASATDVLELVTEGARCALPRVPQAWSAGGTTLATIDRGEPVVYRVTGPSPAGSPAPALGERATG